MHPEAQRALRAYASTGIETGLIGANPHRLILMLFEGAQLALANARRQLQAGETAAKGSSISKAIMIIDGGLKASLDVKSGGELGVNLAQLYDYMTRRLLHANLRNDAGALEEVARLLADLHGAWKSIGEKPQPAARDGAASPISSRA